MSPPFGCVLNIIEIHLMKIRPQKKWSKSLPRDKTGAFWTRPEGFFFPPIAKGEWIWDRGVINDMPASVRAKKIIY